MNIYLSVKNFVNSEIEFYDQQADKTFEHIQNKEYLKAGAVGATTTARITLLTCSVAFAAFAAMPMIAMIFNGPLVQCATYALIAAALYGGHRLIDHYDPTDLFYQAGTGIKQCFVTAGECAVATKEWLTNFNI